MEKNYYYTILGVKKDASQDEIKKAYHRMAKVFHPDSGTANDEMFKMVNEAYATLGDPKKRKDYDWQQEGNSYSGNSSYSNRSSYSSGNSSGNTYNSSNFGGDRRFTREYFHREDNTPGVEPVPMTNPWNYGLFRMTVLGVLLGGFIYLWKQNLFLTGMFAYLGMFISCYDRRVSKRESLDARYYLVLGAWGLLFWGGMWLCCNTGGEFPGYIAAFLLFFPFVVGVCDTIHHMKAAKVKKGWISFFLVFLLTVCVVYIVPSKWMYQCYEKNRTEEVNRADGQKYINNEYMRNLPETIDSDYDFVESDTADNVHDVIVFYQDETVIVDHEKETISVPVYLQIFSVYKNEEWNEYGGGYHHVKEWEESEYFDTYYFQYVLIKDPEYVEEYGLDSTINFKVDFNLFASENPYPNGFYLDDGTKLKDGLVSKGFYENTNGKDGYAEVRVWKDYHDYYLTIKEENHYNSIKIDISSLCENYTSEW